MTVFCFFPGCGKPVYGAPDKGSPIAKLRAHSIPHAERASVAKKLKMSSDTMQRSQLIFCGDHFRPDAYIPNTTRLRKDEPFLSLLILPDSEETAQAPLESAKSAKNTPAKPRETAAADPADKPAPLSRTDQSHSASPGLALQSDTTPKPVPSESIINSVVQAFTAAIQNAAKPVANNQNPGNINFEMKKKRIEATMHYLQKEKELENRLKASETEAQLYKARFEAAQAELNQKREEVDGLKALFDELKKEKNALMITVADVTKQRRDLEERNLILKGDIQFNYELHKAKMSKRAKADESFEVESLDDEDEDDTDEAPAPNSVAKRLRELEKQLQKANERREADVIARDKEIVDMKKDLKVLNSEYQHLYETNLALRTDLTAYRKLVHLEDSKAQGSASKKRRTTDSCQDESDKDESLPGSSSSD